MKLCHIPILVSSLVMSTSTNICAATIYNKYGNKLDMFCKINEVYSLSRDKKREEDKSTFSYGINVEKKIKEQMISFFAYEYELALRNKAKQKVNNTRLSFLGLKCKYGTLDFGRNYNLLYDIGSGTDMFPELGNNLTNIDNLLYSKSKNVTTYRKSKLLTCINFALQYQFKNKNNFLTKKELTAIKAVYGGDGYGLSLSYNLGKNLFTNISYNKTRRNITKKDVIFKAKKKINTSYAIGFKYDDAKHLSFTILYSKHSNLTTLSKHNKKKNLNFKDYLILNKGKNLEIIMQYKFACGLRSSISYLKSKGFNPILGRKNNIRQYIKFSNNYFFNKKISINIEYRLNMLKHNNKFINATNFTENIIFWGLNYVF